MGAKDMTAAGDSGDGYTYPRRQPKAAFGARALNTGAAMLAYTAIQRSTKAKADR